MKNIEELTSDLKKNEKVELHGKIEEERMILSKAMEEFGKKSDTTDDQIKEVLKTNINLKIGKRMKELKKNTSKHKKHK